MANVGRYLELERRKEAHMEQLLCAPVPFFQMNPIDAMAAFATNASTSPNSPLSSTLPTSLSASSADVNVSTTTPPDNASAENSSVPGNTVGVATNSEAISTNAIVSTASTEVAVSDTVDDKDVADDKQEEVQEIVVERQEAREEEKQSSTKTPAELEGTFISFSHYLVRSFNRVFRRRIANHGKGERCKKRRL